MQYFVALIDSEIVGFIHWTQKSGFRSEVVLELEQIAVIPEKQNLGIGRKLIEASIPMVYEQLDERGAKIKHIIVTTRADNYAQKLYRKSLGAEVESTITDLYSADEVIMIARNVDMKTFYFIRHAQSEANLKGILASRQDFPLTRQGRQEAVVIASELKNTARLDRIICSPLIRAQQTALPIAEAFGLDIETDERITEQDLGVFSGMTYAELGDHPDYVHERAKRWQWIPEGGGESYEMIAKRLKLFFQSLQSLEGNSILFVTHAVTLRMVKAILEQTLPDYPHEIARNGEIWKVPFRGLGKTHAVESIFLGGSNAATSRA